MVSPFGTNDTIIKRKQTMHHVYTHIILTNYLNTLIYEDTVVV